MSPARDTEKAEPSSTFFRCPVQSEVSQGLIKIGRRTLPATIQEASIEGFTALVEPKFSNRLSVGTPWILEYNGAKFEIQAQWFFHSPDGRIQIGMRRLRDLTAPEQVGSWWSFFGGKRGVEDAGHSTVVFAGFVLVVFVTLSLPGLGEKLGTAERINDSFQWLIHGINRQFTKTW